MADYCRLCLSPEAAIYHNILSHAAMVANLLDIHVHESDVTSKLICDPCLQKLVSHDLFRQNCRRNNRRAIDLVQAKEEVIDVDTSNEDDEIEVRNENITVKSELTDFERFDVSMTNGSSDVVTEDENQADVESAATAAVEEHEKETVSTEGQETPETIVRRLSESCSEKIEFVAGLNLIKNDATPIEIEKLSALETSYLKKCKAMVNMYRTLKCACHLASHPNLKGLLSHLRSLKMWFPVFTCYNCMITFVDRSSSGKHLHKCPNKNLDALVKLSNLKERSSFKTRMYQNYRCVKCRFIYSFHEDFCKHINEEHSEEVAPYICSCQKSFDSLTDYKNHMYVSCMVEYYCDICNTAVKTQKEFINHAQHQHDNSEGFALLQEDNFKKRSFSKVEHREDKEILGKRRSSTYSRAPIVDSIDDDIESPAKTPRSNGKVPTKCPQCDKMYSSKANMLRHFRIHQDEVKPDITEAEAQENCYYRCPDCQIMFIAATWEAHKESHEKIKCSECDEIFFFQSELEKHMGVHLNLKVTRYAETDSHKSPHPELPICDICNILWENFDDLESHNLSHKAMHERIRRETSRISPKPVSPIKRRKFRKSANQDGEDYHTCKRCFKVFSNKYNLKMHMKLHGINVSTTGRTSKSPQKFHCDRCDLSFATTDALNTHTDGEHNDMPEVEEEELICGTYIFTCDVCVQTFSKKAALIQHKLKHHAQKFGPFEKTVTYCKFCKIGFGSTEDLDVHMIQAHAETPKSSTSKGFYCEICNKRFYSQSAMNAHQERHRRNSNYGPLTTPPKKPVQQPRMKKAEFECDACGYKLPNDVALEIHMIEKHGNVNAFLTPRCGPCNQEFDTQTEYENHIKLHEIVENPNVENVHKVTFSCQLYPACKNEMLQSHVKLSHPTYPEEYKCPHCGRVFDKQASLFNHVKWHENQNTVEVGNAKLLFYCPICNMGFNLTKDLRSHTFSAHPLLASR